MHKSYPYSFDNFDGDESFLDVSSALLTGDTSKDEDLLALPELTSTLSGLPNEGVDSPLLDFSGDVDADIGVAKICGALRLFAGATTSTTTNTGWYLWGMHMW